VLTIAVTAFGDLEGRTPVLRSGARPGDVIAHAGARGDAARGLALLFERATDASGEPDPDATARVRAEFPGLVSAQLAPAPPVFAGVVAAIAGATAMLDVSDGLARDALRVARASGVDLDFASERLGAEPHIALAGAEDHGLLATFPPDAAIPAPFEPVGRVVAGDGVVRVDGEIAGTGGWDPYAGWDGRAG
jgi:thiamine-monophosphate kinase